SPGSHTNTTTECFQATLPPPSLTVTKLCLPANDPGLFNLLVDSVSLLTDATCGKTGSRTVTVGAHTVTETEGTGTSIANYGSITGGNCAPDGTITLGLGQSATCTITNVRQDPSSPQPATLTVNKTCDPSGDNGLFDLYVDDLPRFPDVDCGGSTGAVTVAAG